MIIRSSAAILTALLCLTATAMLAMGEDIGTPSVDGVSLEDGVVSVTWSPPPAVHLIEQVGCNATNLSMTPIAAAFMDDHPLIEIELRGGTNDLAYSRWTGGASDIAQASRPIDKEERALAEGAGLDVVDIVVGAEAVAVVTSPGLGVPSLTTEQLRGLYNGSITTWTEVGGPEVPVELVGAPQGTNAFNLIRSMVLTGGDYAPMTQLDDEDVPAEVRSRSGAIGILLSGLLPDDGRDLVIDIAKEGGRAVSPFDREDIFFSTYPLARTFRLTTDSPPEGAAGTWMDYVLDPAKGQRILVENGFMALSDEQREESRSEVASMLDGTLLYRVYRTHEGTEAVFETADTTFLDTAPPTGANVTYEIAAVIEGTEGERSAPYVQFVPAGEEDALGYLLPFAAVGGITLIALLVWVRRRR